MNIFHIKRQIVDTASQQRLPWQYRNTSIQNTATSQAIPIKVHVKANNINNSGLLNDLHG